MRHGYTRAEMIADRMDALGVAFEAAQLPMHEICREYVHPPITASKGHSLVADWRRRKRVEIYKGARAW